MCYNGFTVKINLFLKSMKFEDGKCTYKKTGLSDLNKN